MQPTTNKGVVSRVKKLKELNNSFESKLHLVDRNTLTKKGIIKTRIIRDLLRLQSDVIVNNKKISMPSLLSFAIAYNCSVKHVQNIINELINKKLIILSNWFKSDETTGEILEFDQQIQTKKFKRRITNGKLRYMINPLRKVAAYISAKNSTNKRLVLAKKFISNGWSSVTKFYSSLKFVSSDSKSIAMIKTDKAPPPSNPDDDDWPLDL